MKEMNPPAIVKQAEAEALSYAEAVRELEDLSQNNWRIGEIADRVKPQYGEETLQRLAEDSGIEYKTLLACRVVHRAWPSSRRLENLSWSVHQTFASQEDRFNLIKRQPWTLSKAREEVKKRKELPLVVAEEPKEYIVLPAWEEMSAADRKFVLRTNLIRRFNDQGDNENIEWALWSWNPVTGCRHNCPYCYARDIANRFYEQKFEPSLWPSRLAAPKNTPFPADKAEEWMGHKNVFTCSMADLFGRWVPSEWIELVLDAVRDAPHWNFLFLTKFPNRMAEFEFPDNAWVGTSVDCQARVANAEKSFRKIKAGVKWLSCEPLIEPLHFTDMGAFDWVVIGGSSRSSQTPEWIPPYWWVADLSTHAKSLGVRVYHKSNLGLPNHLRVREYPGVDPEEPAGAPEQLHYLPEVK